MLNQTEFVRQTELLAEVPHLKAYARLMLNDVTLADYAVQTSLEKAIAFQDDLALSRFPRTWPLHILRNLFFTDESLAGRRRHETDGFPLELANLERRPLCRALIALPFDEREAVILTSSRAYTPFEIGEVCNCDQFTVTERYRKGFSMLLQFMYGPQSATVH